MPPGLAEADRISTKHAIKQVDRLLSSPTILLENIFAGCAPWWASGKKSPST